MMTYEEALAIANNPDVPHATTTLDLAGHVLAEHGAMTEAKVLEIRATFQRGKDADDAAMRTLLSIPLHDD